jgi:hypothetical protein
MHKDYQKTLDKAEKLLEDFREQVFELAKPTIEAKAVAIGRDIINTDLCLTGLSTENRDFTPTQERKLDELSSFLAKLEDTYRTRIYFRVKEGKFQWYPW